MASGSGKGSRKIGRNQKWCQAYRANGVRERNKIKRLTTYVRRYPEDLQAANRLRSLTHPKVA
jgi:hypothetical protein